MMMTTSRRSSSIVLFLASIAISSFFATAVSAFAPIKSSSRSLHQRSFHHHNKSPSSSTTSLSSSRDKAEQYLSTTYPQFYYLLQQNPTALNLMRNSKSGFTLFAPSNDSIAAYPCNLLSAACNNDDMQPVIAKMASYHIVNAPMSVELLGRYGVASTPGGELTTTVVQHDDDGGGVIMFENGVSVIESYEFQDELVQNVQDVNGNLVESSSVGGGKTCIVHEVDGFVC
ncbi:hypothetical protein QTG54_015860, partial [Skeletonema marinoi]